MVLFNQSFTAFYFMENFIEIKLSPLQFIKVASIRKGRILPTRFYKSIIIIIIKGYYPPPPLESSLCV
ncbi:hypothetical protein [Helicobacter rappini]|uniref:hypothetical protein n=1 Tax=Helicobacter rappini TaxID=95150 RepID=UPI0018F845A0|nr:hypothetical protein [Helicobacter rappini]